MFPTWLPVFGERDKSDTKVESWHQHQFFGYIRRSFPGDYGRIAFHPKNESKRSHGQAWYDKNQGLTPGVSDIIIPGNPTFVCELKRPSLTDNAIISAKSWGHQLDFLSACAANGSFVCLARGVKGAEEAFLEYKQHCG